MASLESTIRQLSTDNTAKTFDFNSKEAQKARDWQEMMSNTSHQREVSDLIKAGLNPVLSANGGAQSYSASSASGSADSSAVSALANIYDTKLQNSTAVKVAKINERIAKANNATQKKVARINAGATKYASDNATSATRYASDQSLTGSYYATDHSKYGMLDSLVSAVFDNDLTPTKTAAAKVTRTAKNNIKNSFKNLFKHSSVHNQNIRNRISSSAR